ncbi:MFS transporter [Staphylococcus succinus]|nr:MFS transporter [Staphylococcus succinus]
MKSRNIQSITSMEYIIIITAGIGMFLSSLDTGIINVALPTLTQTFDVSVSTITWSISLYTLALISFVVTFGKLSDKYGRISIYMLGLIIFSLSSILCGLSLNAPMLIAFRVLQGIGASMLQGTSAAIITTMIPQKKHTQALGVFAVFISLGPVLGPSIGGFLISLGGWPLIFFINIPFAAIAMWGAFIIKKRVVETKHNTTINIIENIILIISILSLLMSINYVSNYGVFSSITIILFVIFIVFLIVFIYRELTINNPMLDLKIFKNLKVTTLLLSFLILGGSTSIIFIVPPYYLERLKGMSSWQVGLINLFTPLAIAIFSQVSGKYSEKIGQYRFIITGFSIMTLSFLIMTQVEENWSIIILILLLILYGIGGGFFIPPNTALTMGSVSPQEQGTIGALQRMAQNIGIALYTSISSTLIANNENDLTRGFSYSWFFAFFTLLLMLILLIIINTKYKSKQIKNVSN